MEQVKWSTVDDSSGARSEARPGADAHAVFGQVMGLVAVSIGFTAFGAYTGRDLSGGWAIAAFVVAFAALIGLHAAAERSQSLAVTLLFGVGLLLGLALGPGLAAYTAADPAVVWQAAGATALFTAGVGAYGWATQRDLSGVARAGSWALLALIVFALVAVFVTIPGANVVFAVAGLVIFAGLTAWDFQRLRVAGEDEAVPIAASIFLDVLNVFQFLLVLLGGGDDR